MRMLKDAKGESLATHFFDTLAKGGSKNYSGEAVAESHGLLRTRPESWEIVKEDIKKLRTQLNLPGHEMPSNCKVLRQELRHFEGSLHFYKNSEKLRRGDSYVCKSNDISPTGLSNLFPYLSATYYLSNDIERNRLKYKSLFIVRGSEVIETRNPGAIIEFRQGKKKPQKRTRRIS